MEAYLRPLVSCCLYTTIIRQKKKDLGEIEKIEKYSEKNVYVRIAYNFWCVCVCVCIDYICILLCVAIYVIASMCMFMMIHAPRGRFEVVS